MEYQLDLSAKELHQLRDFFDALVINKLATIEGEDYTEYSITVVVQKCFFPDDNTLLDLRDRLNAKLHLLYIEGMD